MAARVLLLSILFTVGLLARSKELELGLQFSVEPQDCIICRNKPALLQCSSTSQNVSFGWTLDNKPLVNSSRVQLLSNGSLFFKKVLHKKSGHGLSDQGIYRCIIRSPVGALVSRPAHVRFASMSHEFAESGGYSVSVVEGDPVWLPCNIDSLPPAQFSWQRHYSPLPHSDRYIILTNGTLIINQARKEDQGNYSCTAWNSLVNKTRVSAGTILTVEEREVPSPLEILLPLQVKVNWTQGERVSLVCVARGSPTPLVKWTKMRPDQSSVLVTNVTEGVSLMTIDNVTAAHAGVYTCVASQAAQTNTVSLTKEVRVEQVLRAPVITKSPVSQETPTAKIVRFQCEADGNPPPDIVWYRNGRKLHINGRIKLRKELLLSNTVSNDSGVYQCVATNSVGTAWVAARLLVNVSSDQPRPPSHLACTTLSSSAVQLSWTQDNPLGLQAFTVHYFPSDGGEERMSVTEMVQDQVNQTFTVEKLPPYTNFTFYVRSYNNYAASDSSEEVVCQTGESVPIGAPTTTVRPASPRTVQVEWTALDPCVARGAISEHKVQWRRLHNPSTHVDMVPADVTSYTITGLQPETQYEVRVLAATHKGWPTLSEEELPWFPVTTPSLAAFTPLLPPPTVQLTVVNDTTIQVRWTLSEKVDGFHLFYRKHNGQLSSPVQLPANSSEYLLLDLEPQTWYEVQVRAMTGSREGEIGVRAIHTLPPLHHGSPALSLAPPTNLEAVPTSPFSINLTWVPPLDPDNTSYFTVSYRQVSPMLGDHTNTSFLHSTSNGVQVTGLQPFTLYELKVRTHDHSNRHSEYSQTLECSTLEGVPGKVEEVQWKPVNMSSVRVMWKEPNVTNGHIIGYTVSYTKQPRLPRDRWKNIMLQGTKPSADLAGLTPNAKYTLVVQAATIAGLGDPSEPLQVFIPTRDKPYSSTVPSYSPPNDPQDQFLGIVLGCAIGGCCVVLCMATLLYRRKCSKPQCRGRTTAANGAPCFHSAPEHHEMQCLPHHLDTKGGHSNGEVNGLKLPLLSNGRLPNGLITRDRNVRITENPQFECGVTISCEELRPPSDEGDSLLSGHSLNDTTTTTPAMSVEKHEPDDGFHESHQPMLVVGPNG